MNRKCKVCIHPDREAIEKRLIAGEPLRKIAACYGTSAPTLHRHKVGHLMQSLVKAREAQNVVRAGSVLMTVCQQVETLCGLGQSAREILETAKRSKNSSMVLKAIREAVNVQKENRATHELIAKLTGEMSRVQKVEHSGGNIPFLIVTPLPSGRPSRRPVEIDIPGRMALPAADAEIIDGDPDAGN